MILSPQLIEQWQKSGFQCSASSWQQPSRNAVGIWDLAAVKPNREVYLPFFPPMFSRLHVYQTHNDTHDLTDDNYSMSTFAVLLRADADSSPSPIYKNFRDSMSSHVCLFIIYLSPDIQEVASQASHKSSCLSRRDRVSRLDFQLLLVNQNNILKINWVTGRPLKANYNSTICYSHILWPLVCEAKYAYVCVWMDQLKDLIGLHCTSGSVENNGVVLLQFFIRLIIIIIQVYTSQETWLDLVILTSAHQMWQGYSFHPLFISFFPKLVFNTSSIPLKNMFLSSSVCVHACFCVCLRKSHWYRTNCQNKSCSIQNRLSCQGHIFLLPISWQTLSQQLSVVFSVLVSRAPPRPF